MNNPGRKPTNSRGQLTPNQRPRLGSDPVVARLQAEGLPVTRRNYLKFMGDLGPEGPDQELEALQIPEELRAGGPRDV